MINSKYRIEILDSFRGIAIISVLLFHFFSCYLPPIIPKNLYPYGDRYNFFGYGYMGVHFFFIISGFVIHYTLKGTSSYRKFWGNRFKRLYPSMIVASILLFVICYIIDKDGLVKESYQIKNFIQSITFLPPNILTKIFGEITYINGSFWSLWPEIKFYLICSSLYYFNPLSFLRNLIIIIIMYFLSYETLKYFSTLYDITFHISKDLIINNINILSLFSFSDDLIYFGIGVLLFSVYESKQKNTKLPIYIGFNLFLFFIFQFWISITVGLIVIKFAIFLLFGIMIYYPNILSALKTKFLINIGYSSYFLYLIHAPIGLVLINSYGNNSKYGALILPISLIIFFALISFWYTVYIEKRIKLYIFKTA